MFIVYKIKHLSQTLTVLNAKSDFCKTLLYFSAQWLYDFLWISFNYDLLYSHFVAILSPNSPTSLYICRGDHIILFLILAIITFHLLSLMIIPTPTWPCYKFNAPSKFNLSRYAFGGFHWYFYLLVSPLREFICFSAFFSIQALSKISFKLKDYFQKII